MCPRQCRGEYLRETACQFSEVLQRTVQYLKNSDVIANQWETSNAAHSTWDSTAEKAKNGRLVDFLVKLIEQVRDKKAEKNTVGCQKRWLQTDGTQTVSLELLRLLVTISI